MLAWLRRHQPGNVGLAILYWTALTLVAFALLFLFFFYVVDRILPPLY